MNRDIFRTCKYYSETVGCQTYALVATVEIIIRHRGFSQTCRLSGLFVVLPSNLSHRICRYQPCYPKSQCKTHKCISIRVTLTWGVRNVIIFCT